MTRLLMIQNGPSLGIAASFLWALALRPCLAPAHPAVIYGHDDRSEVNVIEEPAWVKKASQAVALLVNRSQIKEADDGSFKIIGPTFKSRYGLCEGERFADQIAPGFCTGFLVGEDLLLTAGHCLKSLKICQQTAFVFDFALRSPATTSPIVRNQDIYHCKALKELQHDRKTGLDFALVELDSAAQNRRPLTVRRLAAPLKGDSDFALLGHPSGLPMKWADHGALLSQDKAKSLFKVSLDAYGASSGSPVFDRTTGLVEGLLLGGENDFVVQNGCRRSHICAEGACVGETVLRTDVFEHLLPSRDGSLRATQLIFESELVGNGDQRPDPGETIPLNITLTNDGADSTSPASLQLTSQSPGVNVVIGVSSEPELAPRATIQNNDFMIKLNEDLSCAAEAHLSLTARYGNTGRSSNLTFKLGRPKTLSFTTTAGQKIPDGSASSLKLPIAVPIAPAGRPVQFAVTIDHPHPTDLRLDVVSPSGHRAVLYLYGLQPPGSPSNTQLNINGLYGADVVAYQNLNGFASEERAGQWQFLISDRQHGQVGSVRQLALLIQDRECSRSSN